MTKKLNIFELHRIINEKYQRKSECYEKVLEICHRKITMATEHKQIKTLFEVPEYVYGFPIFNINDCINFLLQNLKSNGFLVNYYFPKILYISWDFNEIKKTEEDKVKLQANIQSNIQDKLELTSLMNQHKQNQNTQKQKQVIPQVSSSLITQKQNSAALKIKSSGRLALNIF